MNLSQAERILGVKLGSSDDAVRLAFSVAVKANHPDTAALGEPGATLWGMAQLKQARDLLLGGSRGGTIVFCPHCRDTGWQSIGLHRVSCVKGCKEA